MDKQTNRRPNKLKLDKEEQQLLTSVEKGEWKTIANFDEELAIAQTAAVNALRKNARINIRLSNTDLDRIKQIAAHEGLAYQSLISSVLHMYATGHLNKTSFHNL